jgi:tetratricopeptide (TPR) repeat protein
LRIERQQERDDRNTLMIYRLMYDTHAMTAGSDYIEMAQLLGDAALSGEAQRVLQQALSGGFIGNEQKERTNRLLTQLKTRADTDRASLTQLDADAAENPAGELDVKLGELYYGSGDYENAIKAITRGLQKGFVNHPDDGYVYLGRAQTALHDASAAESAFRQVKSAPNVGPRVADLWQLYADTRP